MAEFAWLFGGGGGGGQFGGGVVTQAMRDPVVGGGVGVVTTLSRARFSSEFKSAAVNSR